MLMTRFPNPEKEPVLLLHGLAQGFQIFWSDTIPVSLGQFFSSITTCGWWTTGSAITSCRI
ncbi:MAG: hypothetical protein U5O39_12000 [Gammaproteobacteria bacterium]|nr:hypothetical protein [Gammaproteobacteria bacterium]